VADLGTPYVLFEGSGRLLQYSSPGPEGQVRNGRALDSAAA
jgi:hypothetical protein